MAKKLKIDLNEPAKKKIKFDPSLKDGSICKKKLGDFPDEILLKILSYVDTINQVRLQQVSKRFRNICQDQSLCQRVVICDQNLPAEFLQKQLHGGCKYLNLRNCKIRNLQLKQPVEPSKLEDLNLSLCDFDEQSLINLVLPCRSLKTIILTNVTSCGIGVSRSKWFDCLFDRICLRNGTALQVLSIKLN